MSDTSKTPTTEDSAALVDTVVTTYRAGMSPQNRLDAQNTNQFAALAASAEFSRKEQREEWFDRMLEVMRTCGWSVQERAYDKQTASSTSITVGSVALNVFGAVGRAALGGPIGQALGALAERAFSGLETMTKDVEVFLSRKKTTLHGLTGIVGCVESEGSLYMVVSALDAKIPDNDLDVLGINVHIEGNEFYKGTAVLTFNGAVYANVREGILGKLGDHASAGVLAIKLP